MFQGFGRVYPRFQLLSSGMLSALSFPCDYQLVSQICLHYASKFCSDSKSDMCILNWADEQRVPSRRQHIYFGSICLDSLDEVMTCEALRGPRRGNWEVGRAKGESSVLAIENRIRFLETTWIRQRNQAVACLLVCFFTCRLYTGEIMPFVL